jgi:hypothetical protein
MRGYEYPRVPNEILAWSQIRRQNFGESPYGSPQNINHLSIVLTNWEDEWLSINISIQSIINHYLPINTIYVSWLCRWRMSIDVSVKMCINIFL